MAKILILVELLQLLRVTGKPIYCSAIYAAIIFIFGVIFGESITTVLISTAIGFVLSTAYFYFLDIYSDSGYYWIILVLGLLIGFV